jgi:hypothetical protein
VDVDFVLCAVGAELLRLILTNQVAALIYLSGWFSVLKAANFINLALDIDQQRDVMNAVINFPTPFKAIQNYKNKRLPAAQE